MPRRFSKSSRDRVFAVNLTSVWLCMRHEIPAMLEWGGAPDLHPSDADAARGVLHPIAPARPAPALQQSQPSTANGCVSEPTIVQIPGEASDLARSRSSYGARNKERRPVSAVGRPAQGSIEHPPDAAARPPPSRPTRAGAAGPSRAPSGAEFPAGLRERADLAGGHRRIGLVERLDLTCAELTVVRLGEIRDQREGLVGRVLRELVDQLVKALTNGHDGSV